MAVEVAPPVSSAADPGEAALTEEFSDFSPTDAHAPDDESGSDATSAEPSPVMNLSPQDDVDFLLHPVELAKGRRAAENYLSSFRSDETRKTAEEALETLATVISGGKCDSLDFPWQQIRPYHGAAALTIIKEKGAPARVEALRCRADTTRGYRVVPEAYPARQVQKIRSTLTKVIEECGDLGFIAQTDEEATPAETTAKKPTAKKATGKSKAKNKSTPKKTAGGRLLGDGELRALVAAANSDSGPEGTRDAVFFSLAYRGLKIAEITGLTPDSVKFSNKTGVCSIVAKPSRGGGRGRRIELTNEELIVLEDWLDHRGDDKGPLLCTLVRGGKVEGKRLTTAMLKEICDRRAEQAQVAEFTTTDLSRSAEALTNHRKAAKRKASRLAQENLSSGEKALYLAPAEADDDQLGETIQFPFLGLKA